MGVLLGEVELMERLPDWKKETMSDENIETRIEHPLYRNFYSIVP